MFVLLVWLTQQTLKTQKNRLNVVHSAPLLVQDIQANSTRKVNIGVIDGSDKEDFWVSIWVILWKLKGKLECEVGVRCIVWSVYGCGPETNVVFGRES